jgi:hypothetical protein
MNSQIDSKIDSLVEDVNRIVGDSKKSSADADVFGLCSDSNEPGGEPGNHFSRNNVPADNKSPQKMDMRNVCLMDGFRFSSDLICLGLILEQTRSKASYSSSSSDFFSLCI